MVKSKSAINSFYSFKLRMVINDKAKIIACKLISTKTEELKTVVNILIKSLTGKFIGNKKYRQYNYQKLCRKKNYDQSQTLKKIQNSVISLFNKALLNKIMVNGKEHKKMHYLSCNQLILNSYQSTTLICYYVKI